MKQSLCQCVVAMKSELSSGTIRVAFYLNKQLILAVFKIRLGHISLHPEQEPVFFGIQNLILD